ncbi:hypothetical protein EJB05_30196, partial [Eragrostis curvula]
MREGSDGRGEMSKQYRDNARSWSIKAKKAMSEGGTSDNNMVEFLAQLRPNCPLWVYISLSRPSSSRSLMHRAYNVL